jgi:hypothetical protein
MDAMNNSSENKFGVPPSGGFCPRGQPPEGGTPSFSSLLGVVANDMNNSFQKL